MPSNPVVSTEPTSGFHSTFSIARDQAFLKSSHSPLTPGSMPKGMMRNPVCAIIECKTRDSQLNTSTMQDRPGQFYSADWPVLHKVHQILWKGAVSFEEQPKEVLLTREPDLSTDLVHQQTQFTCAMVQLQIPQEEENCLKDIPRHPPARTDTHRMCTATWIYKPKLSTFAPDLLHKQGLNCLSQAAEQSIATKQLDTNYSKHCKGSSWSIQTENWCLLPLKHLRKQNSHEKMYIL